MKKKSKQKPQSKKLKWTETELPVKEEAEPCKHHFLFLPGGECKCRGCGLGLMGVIDLIDGKPV